MIRCEECNALISWNDGNLEGTKWIVYCPNCEHENMFHDPMWEDEVETDK